MIHNIDYTCKVCGGRDVFVDAVADWDIENQKWELQATYDPAYCNDCDSETDIEETDIEEMV